MKFRTEYESRPAAEKISPAIPAVLVGSCFSDNIGSRMLECGWEACVNPCGVLYNPLSISRILSLALATEEERIKEVRRSLTRRDDAVASWLFSGRFASSSATETEHRCLEGLENLSSALRSAGVLVITLGTAYVYFRNGEAVSNCHKYPEKEFTRRRLDPHECAAALRLALEEIHRRYPALRIILTVSPVRHLRDGFEGNSRSKAVLLLAAEELLDRHITYFPAFEILTDDLRDYRFYADDLLHPSAAGIEYIWKKFTCTYLDNASRETLRRGLKQQRNANHRKIIDND